MSKIIYNLEFPEKITTLNICGYEIKRLPEYAERYPKMMWLVNSSGSEFSTNIQTGSHQATAIVREINKPAILEWGEDVSTRLNDICIVLGLFTGRHVFAIDKSVYSTNPTLISDHRMFNYGGILKCSLPFEEEYFNEETLQPLTAKELKDDKYYFLNARNIGFAKGINNVLDLIATQDWQDAYGKGYFLLLFKQALFRMNIEPTFILCWAMWEHLYGAIRPRPKNRQGVELTDDQIEKTVNGDAKIAYLLKHIFGLTLRSESHNEIRRIVNARNKLMHFGKKPDNVDYSEMDLFVRATECLVCKILNLTPSNLFNTNEKLAQFLNLTR